MIRSFLWQSCNSRGTARASEALGARLNMQVILERVKIDLDEDEIPRLIDAVDYYEAYLHSQQRGREEVPRTAPGACLWQRIAFKGAKFCTNCDAPWY